uniref:Myrcene synthase n=1 Tax=Lilium sp. BT-2016 TaxID=1824561 RepID=A0A144J2D9_9LILI|nr:myrcene synthase [Lilium sp. BT-2016]
MAFALVTSAFPPLSRSCQLFQVPKLSLRPNSTFPVVCLAQHTAETTVTRPRPRRSGNYPPKLWDDVYIQSLRNGFTEVHADRIDKLKEDVRRLIEEEKELIQQLELVDSLEQLGVAYHFEEEIEKVLEILHDSMEETKMEIRHDIYATSLLFRLLREHGFTASQDVFNSFKDENGNFKSCHNSDVRGLLGMYHASYLSMENEKTMDEARDFATRHLKDLVGSDLLEPCLREDINYALEIPYNFRVQRLHTKWFIERYQREEKMNPLLLEFAKLDYNMVQDIYKRELGELSRWWDDLKLLGDELSFVRDRLVENYFWAVGWAFEPNSCRCREAITKVICFISTIDDIYDIYGSLDELELFTDAVERWEINAIDQLPEYMKPCFLGLLNTTNDIVYKILRDKCVNIISYLKKAWVDLCKAYLLEAKWYFEGYTPTLEEYLENAWVSITGPLNLIVAYCVNEDVTTDNLNKLTSHQDIIFCSSMIIRLCDDLGTSSDEIERGDVQKSIQCYMQQKDVSELVAREHIKDLISIYWKRMNMKRFAGSRFERVFKNVAFNLPRSSHAFYQYGDGYGTQPNRKTQDQIISLFIERI